ncbi:MAG: DUF6958 family protein [Shimia sp.]
MADGEVEVRTPNAPDRVARVNAAEYGAIRDAVMATITDSAPGMTEAETKAALPIGLDPVLFPGGETAGSWMKTVQLDLEARGLVARVGIRTLRFHEL